MYSKNWYSVVFPGLYTLNISSFFGELRISTKMQAIHYQYAGASELYIASLNRHTKIARTE